jgi:hypothetical protein
MKGAKATRRERRVEVLHAIQAVLGVFLIAAGSLKFGAAATGGGGFLKALSMVFSLSEILGGLWLIAGYDPVRTRPWVVAVFVGLWATSAYQAMSGKCSCGCFGNLTVNPWLVTLFDLAAIVVLLKWDSDGSANADLLSSTRRMLDLGALAVAMILLGELTQPPLAVAGNASIGGRPLKNVSLEIRREKFLTTVQTDEDGRFRMPPVRPGMYAVTLFDRGTNQGTGGPGTPRLPSLRLPRKMTAKQKKSLAEARKEAEAASRDADAATIWLDLSTCSGDVQVQYR